MLSPHILLNLIQKVVVVFSKYCLELWKQHILVNKSKFEYSKSAYFVSCCLVHFVVNCIAIILDDPVKRLNITFFNKRIGACDFIW